MEVKKPCDVGLLFHNKLNYGTAQNGVSYPAGFLSTSKFNSGHDLWYNIYPTAVCKKIFYVAIIEIHFF